MKKSIKGILCFLFAVVLMLCIASAAGSREAYAAQEIRLSGEKRLSELVADGMTSDDTIYVPNDATLILDMDYDISQITGFTGVLTVKESGSHILTVRNGISVGNSGTLKLESGSIAVTGPLSSDNAVGFYGQYLYVDGGEFSISFNSDSSLHGIRVLSDIKITGGKIDIDVESRHINSYAIETYSLETEGGTIDCSIKTTSGYAYGIYAREMYAKGGSIIIDSARNTSGNYGIVFGIYTRELTIDDASIEVNARSAESHAVGVCTNLLDVNGGYVSAAAETTTVNRPAEGFNVNTDAGDTANWTITAGSVTASGTSPSGGMQACGRGFNIPVGVDVIFTIQGGIVTSEGSYSGIYVSGDSSLEIKGTAIVTAASAGDSGNGIYTVTDLVIGGSAHVNARSVEHNGIYTSGSLSVTGKASVDAVGGGDSGDNTCALYAGGGITLGTNQKITVPSEGSISSSGKIIVEEDSSRAIVAQINYATYIAPGDVYIGDGRYFSSDKLFWSNTEGFISSLPGSTEWNAMYIPDTGMLYLRNYDGGEIGLRIGITDRKLIVVLIGKNKIKKSQFGIYADKNDLEITSPGYGGILEITGYSSGGAGAAVATQWSNPSRDKSIIVSGNAGVYINVSGNGETRGFSAGSDIIIRDHAVADVNVTYGNGATNSSDAFMCYDNVIISTDEHVNASVKGRDYWENYNYGSAMTLYNGNLRSFQIGNAEYVSLSVLGRSSDVFEYDQDDKIEAILEDGLFMGFEGFRKTTRDTDAIFLQKEPASGGKIPVTGAYFPDIDFREYVSDNFDTNDDGWLSRTEIQSIKEIVSSDDYSSVYSVAGIENFPALEYLDWGEEFIRTLDLSGNPEIGAVYVYDDDIDVLNLNGCSKLYILDIRANELTGLDVSDCPALTTLYCGFNYKLESVDITGCPDLLWFDAEDDELLTEIDFSSNKKLQHLNINCCDLTELDVSAMANLEYLDCHANSLNALDVSQNRRLETLKCTSNGLDELELGVKPALIILYCNGNDIPVMEIGGAPHIKDAYLNGTHTSNTDYERYYTDYNDLRVDKTTTIDAVTPIGEVTLKSAYLSLEGKISINFKVIAPDEGYVAKLYYEKAGFAQVAEVPLDSDHFVYDPENYNHYLVTYSEVPAKEMNQFLRIKMFDAYGNQVPMKISSGYIDQYDYSVAKWCTNMINKNANANDVMIAKALLNYGHYSQLALKYNDGREGRPDNMPAAWLESEMGSVTANSAYDRITTGGKELGAKTFILVLESDTLIKLLLERQVNVKIDSTPVTLAPETDANGNAVWAAYSSGVAAKRLHERKALTLTEGSNSATMYYGVLSWANSKLANGNEDDQNLARAMYLYNAAARRYFHYDEAGL